MTKEGACHDVITLITDSDRGFHVIMVLFFSIFNTTVSSNNMGNEKELANCDEHTKRDKKKRRRKGCEHFKWFLGWILPKLRSISILIPKLRIPSTYIQHCCRYCCIV
jgi:hypothetical protein